MGNFHELLSWAAELQVCEMNRPPKPKLRRTVDCRHTALLRGLCVVRLASLAYRSEISARTDHDLAVLKFGTIPRDVFPDLQRL